MSSSYAKKIEETYSSFVEKIQNHSLYNRIEKKKNYFIFLVLGFIAWLGFYIRTRNLPLLIDATTGQYIPSDLDAIGILRYVQYVVEHGQLMSVDLMRYYPTGYTNLEEFRLLAHLIAQFYHIYHFFVPSVTVVYADVIFPAFAFILTVLFFFLFVRKAFDWKVALLASAFLAVIPAFLTRTISGVSDKEAMAMMFFFLTLYLFLSFILEKKFWKSFFYVLGAAISGSFLMFLWGGYFFVFLTIAAFVFILVLLERISLRQLLLYSLFFIIPIVSIKIFYPIRYHFWNLVTTPAFGLLFFALVLGIVHYLLFKKNICKLSFKIPVPPFFISILLIFSLGILFLALYYGPSIFWERVYSIYTSFLNPFSASRWSITVTENFQPYFTDWIFTFGWQYLVAVLLGAFLLVYETCKPLGKKGLYLSITFLFLLLSISLTRYSSESILNGQNTLSQFLFFSGFIIFLGYFLYFFVSLYNKEYDIYKNFTQSISLQAIFILIFLFFLILGARSAIRLLFVFAPVTSILLAYFVFSYMKIIKNVKTFALRTFCLMSILLLVFLLFLSSSQIIFSQAENYGSQFTLQWQDAMDWVRNNTKEDAVFAQWWDYGYYIQTFGERATLSDGGNAVSGINYLIGRHVFTAQNDTEALEFLAAKNTTHILMPSRDVGAYIAISSIASDVNYDRLSWFIPFSLDSSLSKETRNGSILVYSGYSPLDQDLVIHEKLYSKFSTIIYSISIPVITINGTITQIEKPTVSLSNSQSTESFSVECVFYNGEEILFEDADIEACVQIIPSYDGTFIHPAGAVLYHSSHTWHSWFTQHYLFDRESSSFEKVYTEKNVINITYYQGTIIGPVKIWEIHYPNNLTIPEEYYTNTIPQGVEELGIAKDILLH